MTENIQEEMFEKPTATEKKKIQAGITLVSLIALYEDSFGDSSGMKSPKDFKEKFNTFMSSLDEQLMKAILLETIKKQITKVNKML